MRERLVNPSSPIVHLSTSLHSLTVAPFTRGGEHTRRTTMDEPELPRPHVWASTHYGELT